MMIIIMVEAKEILKLAIIVVSLLVCLLGLILYDYENGSKW